MAVRLRMHEDTASYLRLVLATKRDALLDKLQKESRTPDDIRERLNSLGFLIQSIDDQLLSNRKTSPKWWDKWEGVEVEL